MSRLLIHCGANPYSWGVEDLLRAERLTLMGLLVEVMSGLGAKLWPQLGEHGLTDAEFGVLLRLARSPQRRLRMSDLTAQTSLTNSGITRVVDRLERDGLVRRKASEHDRRSIYAVLDDAGMRRVEETLPGHLELVQRWLVDPLSPAEVAAFGTALRKLRDEVRPDATAGADDRGESDAGDGAETGGPLVVSRQEEPVR